MCGRIGCVPSAMRSPAVYLAAGEGRRLRPLTDDRPKAMIEIDGISLAERASAQPARGRRRTESSRSPATGREALAPLGEL